MQQFYEENQSTIGPFPWQQKKKLKMGKTGKTGKMGKMGKTGKMGKMGKICFEKKILFN